MTKEAETPRKQVRGTNGRKSEMMSSTLKPQSDSTRCYWCGAQFRYERGTKPEDGLYAEEVGEFWSETMQDSVLGHPDCTPNGLDAILSGEDDEWVMA